MGHHHEGFTRLWPTVVILVAAMITFALLLWSMRRSMRCGRGSRAVGIFLAGIVQFGETASLARIIAALLILTGVVFMKSATA